jgi:hypothetical protein
MSSDRELKSRPDKGRTPQLQFRIKIRPDNSRTPQLQLSNAAPPSYLGTLTILPTATLSTAPLRYASWKYSPRP